MHWRHIKWRAPWQKRHLSVLEKFLVEDSARKKAAEKERQDAEIARRTSLAGLEYQRRKWKQLNHFLRRILSPIKRDQVEEDSRDELVMSNEDGTSDASLEDAEDADEHWEGNYEALLRECENTQSSYAKARETCHVG